MSAMAIGRRRMLIGSAVTAGVVVGCSREDGTAAAEEGSVELAKTADVPVGSALVVDDIVLTQQQPGRIQGFSAVCPHAGCAVSKVDGAKVVCPCHGSSFGLDGAVLTGPAREPLRPVAVTVRGDSVVTG